MRLFSNFIVALFSIVVIIALAEAVLRFVVPPERFLDPISNEYWLALQTGEHFSPKADVEPDFLLGWRMKRNHRGQKASHNSQGFRGTREIPVEGTGRRIVAIGDSFTYGLGVEDGETFAARLGVLLSGDVANLGVNGYGVDQAVLMWESEGRRLRPNVVVLGYFTHDFHRNAFTVGLRPKPRFVLDSDGRRLVLEPPGPDVRHVAPGWRMRSLDLLRTGWHRTLNRLGVLPEDMLEARQALSEQLLARLQASAAEAGARLVILVIPHEAHPESGFHGEWIAAAIARSCARLDLSCIDLTSATDPSLFHAGHWNAKGHRLAAEKIARTLRGESLLQRSVGDLVLPQEQPAGPPLETECRGRPALDPEPQAVRADAPAQPLEPAVEPQPALAKWSDRQLGVAAGLIAAPLEHRSGAASESCTVRGLWV